MAVGQGSELGTRRIRGDLLYAWGVAVVGLSALVVVLVVDRGDFSHLPPAFWLLAVGPLVGDLAAVGFDEWTDFSASTAYGFAILLTFGLAPVLAALVAGSVAVDTARRRHWHFVVLNAAQFGVTWTLAAGVLALAGFSPGPSGTALAPGDVPAVLAGGLTLFAADGVVIQTYAALLAGQPWLARLRQRLGFSAAEYISALALGTVMAFAAPHPAALAPLLVLPLIASLGTRHTEAHERLATTDPLTGLLNRSAFAARIEDLLSGPRRGTFTLLLLDLDGFKRLNDSAGHAAGDQALVECARRLRAALRASDPIARLGGDEFAVLLPRSSPEGSERAIGALHEALARPVVLEAGAFALTASIGAAHHPDDGATYDELLARADRRMYAEKTARATTGLLAGSVPSG